MPDRYSYSSPWAGGNQPWFRIGQIDVTTTVAVIGLGLISMLTWAIEGPARTVSKRLWLVSDVAGVGSVLEGQIWRLVTWPLANDPDIWTIILFAVFFMLGNQLENLMGRKPFLWYLLLLTVVPAVVVTVFELFFTGFVGFAFGLRFVELGVLVGFAAQYPTARFWPGLPGWVLAAIIVGLDFLQALGDRNDYQLVMLVSVVAVGLVGIRSFGHASEVPQIPRVPLPAFMTGQSAPRRATPAKPARGSGRRNRGRSGHLRAVPGSSVDDDLTEMEIDALLDQVAEQGLSSLTKEQRKRLEDHSKRLRKRRED